MFEIILWEVSLKNKRGRLFFKRLFVPQASQSSHDRRAEPDVLLAVPPARSACGMGGYDERTAFSKIYSKDAPKVAFEAAMRAAAAGFEETRAMKAVWGRAAYYGEKSVALLDGGAAVGKLIFEAINESCGLTACN